MPGKAGMVADLHADGAVEPAFEGQTWHMAGEHNDKAIARRLDRGHRFIPINQAVIVAHTGGNRQARLPTTARGAAIGCHKCLPAHHG